MIIYKATNLLNGRVYVGQTIGTLAQRKGQHYKQARYAAKRGARRSAFAKALLASPVAAFAWEVVATAGNQKDLDALEDQFITKFDSMVEGSGYNHRRGGNGGKASPTAIANMRAAKVGKCPTMATRDKLSRAKKRLRGSRLSMRAMAEIRSNPLGLSQTQLARKLGVDPSYVSILQRGVKPKLCISQELRDRIEFGYVKQNPECLTQAQLAKKFQTNTTVISWIQRERII